MRHPGSGGWASWDPRDPGSWGASAGLQLIDFGRAIDAEALPEEAEFLADFKPGCFRCIEMQEGRTWKYQASYPGCASPILLDALGLSVTSPLIPLFE